MRTLSKPITVEVRVRYPETDQMGVVYHGNYLIYMDIGRTEWLRSRGRTYRDIEAGGYMLPVVEAHVRYRAPARYDDLLEVEVGPEVASTASVRFAYRLQRREPTGEMRLIAEGWTRHACLDRDGNLCRTPPEIEDLVYAD